MLAHLKIRIDVNLTKEKTQQKNMQCFEVDQGPELVHKAIDLLLGHIWKHSICEIHSQFFSPSKSSEWKNGMMVVCEWGEVGEG